MEKIEAKKFEDYPEGSGGKKMYDMFYLPFQDFLNKYYKNPDLSRWLYVNNKFVIPLFDNTSWVDYWDFLHEAKPKFIPIENKKNDFWLKIKDDDRFSIELKQFFTFLYSINFYGNLSFEEWLNTSNWMNSSDDSINDKSIIDLLNYNYSENFIKVRLAELNIF